MKKSEVTTLICGIACFVGLFAFFVVSSKIARAKNDTRKAEKSLTLEQNRSNSLEKQSNELRERCNVLEKHADTLSSELAQAQVKWHELQSRIQVEEEANRRTKEATPAGQAAVTAQSPKEQVAVPRTAVPPPVRLEHLNTDFRPVSGTLILNRFAEPNVFKGYGKITITNGLMEDAFVKVVEGTRLMAAMYVRGNSSFSLTEIPDGSYTILYRTGFGWVEDKRDFERGRGANRFDNELVYSTRVQREGDTIRTFYDTITLTLHKVVDGNAPAEEISEDEFNKYQ